jgi:hypothetical protein
MLISSHSGEAICTAKDAGANNLTTPPIIRTHTHTHSLLTPSVNYFLSVIVVHMMTAGGEGGGGGSCGNDDDNQDNYECQQANWISLQ